MAVIPSTPVDLLADAKAKYHMLLTGGMARVFVDQNGDRVEFTATNASDLLLYIQQLERAAAPVSGRPFVNAPLKFFF